MAYTAKAWTDGDIITADALNNLENGAAQNASDIAEIQASLPNYIGENIPQKTAATYIPNTNDQTIEANQYLSGTQTIKGDTNLTAVNIKSGVSIFGVDGIYVGNSSASPVLQTKTVTPSESQQTVSPDSGYDGLSSVTVDAVSSTYVGSGVTKKAAETYTPNTADQTIASGQYLNGDQIIKGDANLTAANIKSGVSIFGVDGSYEGSGGIDTSDATATAENIEEGMTAYVNGEKITGNLPTSGGSFTWGAPYMENDYIKLKGTFGTRRIFDQGSTLIAARAASDFGDAAAEDVAEGKTFTSSSGVKIVGTNSGSSASGDTNNCEAYHITSVSDTLTFQNAAGTIKVWGYGSKGSSYSTTNYAFVGDGYYSDTYGSYTKTTATFSLNTDGTLSGLPSGLTTLDVLVTIGV